MMHRGTGELRLVIMDEAELIVRMAEAFAQQRRPRGSTAEQALDAMEEDVALAWKRAADAVHDYFMEIAVSVAEHRGLLQ